MQDQMQACTRALAFIYTPFTSYFQATESHHHGCDYHWSIIKLCTIIFKFVKQMRPPKKTMLAQFSFDLITSAIIECEPKE